MSAPGQEKKGDVNEHKWNCEFDLDLFFLNAKTKATRHNQIPIRKNKHQKESKFFFFFTVLAVEQFSIQEGLIYKAITKIYILRIKSYYSLKECLSL